MSTWVVVSHDGFVSASIIIKPNAQHFVILYTTVCRHYSACIHTESSLLEQGIQIYTKNFFLSITHNVPSVLGQLLFN